RYLAGETLDEAILANFLSSSSGAPRHIEVTLPDGEKLSAGTEPQPSFRGSYATDDGVVVIMAISRSDVFWEAARAVGLVFAVAVVAVVAGAVMASWQANRLAAPLVYLAASAELIGSGQTRPKFKPSGVEEIDLVAEELARSADRMAARLSAERQFASDASHQLRTPLTALSMRLEEIGATTTQDEVRAEVDASLEQIERLVGVVDELLGRTRRTLGSGTALVELSGVFEQQRSEWEAAFAKAGRKLRLGDTDATVFATPGGLAQVLATLIENSLIHGGGTTTVAARASGASHAIVIEVRDEGEGVPEEIASRIFERAVTSGKGTGLGLALARDLVTADGGRLELSQRVPAVFSVFLQGVPQMVDLDTVVPHGKPGSVRRRRSDA
ncbi:MAG: HAMP domain-containing histidine kinase, partial [Demequinaceae bacterium]|nr:HAMP domain-containing histidine kinase [Demequinaceae bacterium]